MVTKQGDDQEVRADRVRQSDVARNHRASVWMTEMSCCAARLTNGEKYIFLGSHEGMACRFKESDVRADGPPGARGARHGTG